MDIHGHSWTFIDTHLGGTSQIDRTNLHSSLPIRRTPPYAFGFGRQAAPAWRSKALRRRSVSRSSAGAKGDWHDSDRPARERQTPIHLARARAEARGGRNTNRHRHTKAVMPGLDPGIHVFGAARTWMAGSGPGHDATIVMLSSCPASVRGIRDIHHRGTEIGRRGFDPGAPHCLTVSVVQELEMWIPRTQLVFRPAPPSPGYG